MRHATMPRTVEALLEGRARIENGWCQHELSVYRPECLGGRAYCAIGAVYATSGAVYATSGAVLPYLVSALPTGGWTVPAYNDHPSRTQADILALYDRAIDLALAEARA